MCFFKNLFSLHFKKYCLFFLHVVNKETIDLKREESANDVAGSSSTNILGRRTITHSTEGVSVRKRSACDDGGMPSKKKRSSNLTIPTEHGEGPVEDRNIQNHRRQASVDAGPPVKGKRSGMNDTGEPRVVEKCRMELNKRKARNDAKAPESKRRCGTNSSHEVNMDSEEDEDEVSSSFTEEERIFKLSSIQNLSKGKLTEGNKSFDINKFEHKYRSAAEIQSKV